MPSWTITLDTSNCQDGASCTSRTDSKNFGISSGSAGFSSVNVSSWANTGSGGTLASAQMALYGGGGGVTHQNGGAADSNGAGTRETLRFPQHALDNDSHLELFLFDFGTKVSLSELTLGYRYLDADVSVLAKTGAGPELAGQTYTTSAQDLTANGWELVGNFDVDHNDPVGPEYTQPLTRNVKSASQWLIAAYNPVFGACAANVGYCQLGDYKDYVKLLSVAGNAAIPEPSIVLLLTAGLGLLALRRRVAGV